jgi:ABC-2 type transport system permease protein
MEKINLGKKNVVPNSVTQVMIMTKYSFLDYFRSRRFFVLLIIAVAVGFLLTGIVGYFRPHVFFTSALSFYSNWWGMSATFIIVLSAIFFGGDAISGEFQNKTGYFLTGNPIRRSSIYIGKYLAAFIGSFIILTVFAVITIGNGAYYFGSAGLPYQFFESFLLSVLYILAALGLTFFFSSLFKSSTVSIITTVILLLFVFSLVDTLVATLAGIEPFFMLTYGAQVISNVLSNPYPPAISTTTAGPNSHFTITTYNAGLAEGIIIMLVYFVVCSVAGLMVFERKEFT